MDISDRTTYLEEREDRVVRWGSILIAKNHKRIQTAEGDRWDCICQDCLDVRAELKRRRREGR